MMLPSGGPRSEPNLATMSSNSFRSRCPRLRRATSLLAVAALTLNACTYWAGPERKPVGEIVTQEHPSLVRITMSDGTVRELTHLRIANDSLFGITSGADGPVFAFAVDDIRRIDVNRAAWGRTLGLAALAGIAYTVHSFATTKVF